MGRESGPVGPDRRAPDLIRWIAFAASAALGGLLGGIAGRWGAVAGGLCGGLLGLAVIALLRRPWPAALRGLAAAMLFLAGFAALWLAASFTAVTLGLFHAAGG
jgi:hypothetical protein